MSFQPNKLAHSCQPTKNRLKIGTPVTIPAMTRSRRSLTTSSTSSWTAAG